MTTLCTEPIQHGRVPAPGACAANRWPAGCTVTRQGPLTTIALAGDLDPGDISGLDRAAALAVDLPGLDMLIVDLCDLEVAGPGIVPWLLRVDTWARRAGAALVVLGEPGPVLQALKRTPLRTLRGSAPLV